jgi:hypothetical protein
MKNNSTINPKLLNPHLIAFFNANTPTKIRIIHQKINSPENVKITKTNKAFLNATTQTKQTTKNKRYQKTSHTVIPLPKKRNKT